MNKSSGTWHLMDRFVIRTPGFPFGWLEQLAFNDTTALAHQLCQAQQHKQAQQQIFAEKLFPALCDEETAAQRHKKTFRFWYRLARRIRRGQTVSPAIIAQVHQYGRHQLAAWLQTWQTEHQLLAHLQQQYEHHFNQELSIKRQVLYQTVQTNRFQEALWLSNPAIYEVGWHSFARHWQPNKRPTKIKQLERRFYTYLQRFCAKNDTISFFGPLNYGRFDTQRTGLHYRLDPHPICRRQTFLAYWAAQTLAEQIAADPHIQPYLCPRPNPLQQQPPPAPYQEICRLSNGRTPLTHLADRFNWSLDEMVTAVTSLVHTGWLYLDLPIPPAILFPLDYLIDHLAALPATCSVRTFWLERLHYYRRACNQFTTANLAQRQAILADLESRFSQQTAVHSRRGQGKIFRDRTLLYEECLGDINEFYLGDRQQFKQHLMPIATLCTAYAQAIRTDLQAEARLLFNTLSPTEKPLSFIHFLTAWQQQHPTLPPLPTAERLQRAFTALVKQHQAGRISHLTTTDITALCPETTEPVVCSPDLLLAASDPEAGEYQLVLGEIHGGVQPVGWMLIFAPDQEVWQQEINSLLPQPTPTITPANLLFNRRMKTVPPEFPGVSVQAPAVSLQPQALPLADLVISQTPAGVLQLSTTAGQNLCFYPPTYYVPEALYAPFACFSYLLLQTLPVNGERHIPRIQIDGVVYQREQWHLAAEEMPGHDHHGTSPQLFLDYLIFQEKWELPRHLFVRTPDEPKPVYIDLHNYFALELLVHLTAKSTSVTLIEMLPDPDHLWLQKEDGRYTCEFRTVMAK